MKPKSKINAAAEQCRCAINLPVLFNEFVAAERLGVSPQTMRNWRCQGEGPPFVKISKRLVRYVGSDIEAWIQRGRVDPGAAANR